MRIVAATWCAGRETLSGTLTLRWHTSSYASACRGRQTCRCTEPTGAGGDALSPTMNPNTTPAECRTVESRPGSSIARLDTPAS